MAAAPQIDYLVEARSAAGYARKTLSLGSINKDPLSDSEGSLLGASEFMRKAASHLISRVATDVGRIVHDVGKQTEADLEMMARNAHLFPVGNCNEHAAVAFIFLRDRKIFPVEMIVIQSNDWTPLHAIVVLGRKSKMSAETPPSEWGKGVVVCDPWESAAYLVSERKIPFADKGCFYTSACRLPKS